MGDQLLTDNANNVTSHLQGLFYRTTLMMQEGIKPVYVSRLAPSTHNARPSNLRRFVFDGKPPELKSQELARRAERRGEATAAQEEARQVRATYTQPLSCTTTRTLVASPCTHSQCVGRPEHAPPRCPGWRPGGSREVQ